MPTITGAEHYPIDVAVWAAIAAAVGGGSTADRSPDRRRAACPATSSRTGVASTGCSSGPIAVQPLRSTPIVSLDRNPRGVDVVALDRAEVLVVFGQIAPGKVAAPNPGYNFRIISRSPTSSSPAT